MATMPERDPNRVRPEQAAPWAEQQERSNRSALRLMAWIAVNLGRPVARLLLHPISAYFLLFSPGARRNSQRYLRRALGHAPGWRDRYRHLHAFSAVVLDRIYLARGGLKDLSVQVHGGDLVYRTLEQGRGAFMLGAHIGSFEALHAVGKGEQLPVAMVMYPDNARMIQGVLQAVAPELKLEIIAIGRPGSTLAIRDWLERGGLVGLLGDRLPPSVAAGSGRQEVRELPFLGTPARFGSGPFRLAQMLRRPLLFMVGLYLGGDRYEVRFETLADFSAPPADAAAREQQLDEALRAYVARLEALCREAPYNWFNFHDFWGEDERP
ncbi:MAG TPA: acyl-CoA synthetase [Rubrivivax sp.]|nr:acyl-CoA synthetase [Rubrivivax sp.]